MSVMMVVAVVVVQMVGVLDVVAARHYEDVAVGPQHVDFGAVKLREHRRGDDFIDRAERRLAVAEIEHAVKRAEQLVELVGAEQHRDLALAAGLAHDVDHDFLVALIEADQRLVEQQSLSEPSSACASNSRCRSPPDISDNGLRARSRAPTDSSVSSIMCRSEAESEGRPQPSPCKELPMKSRPRTRKSGSTVRTCGR